MLYKKSTAAWRQVGFKKYYFRSLWEYRYALYLEYLACKEEICGWEFEPQTFWFEGIKRGVCSYLPDFKVWSTSEDHHWVEVKGFWDAKSLTKIKRMRKYFPDEKLVLVDSKWFAANSGKLKLIIPGWEVEDSPKCTQKKVTYV